MKQSKDEARKEIEEFFLNISDKTPKEIRKIKKFAMSYNIPLKEKRKKFCKKCFSSRLKVIGIKEGFKRIKCQDCNFIGKWKLR